MACFLALPRGCPILKVGSHLLLLGPSRLLRWLPCNHQRSVGALPPLHHHLALPPPPLHLHHHPLPLAPVLAILKAPAFLLNLRLH